MFTVLKKHLSGNGRSSLVMKNIIGSFLLKGISILISLQIVPMTLNYINPTRYGIWITLSSIVAWLSYFDLGFSHGFRNRFAEAMAKNQIELAKEYVSTTYVLLATVFSSILLVALLINNYLNWSLILNIDSSYNEELKRVVAVLLCFIGTDMVAKTFTTMLTADQKPALASLIYTGGQFLSFITIYLLVRFTTGNLLYLAVAYTGVPCAFLILSSICFYRSNKYYAVAPTLKSVKWKLSDNILKLGGQFFGIMIAMLFVFQFTNIILSRILGPDSVTLYNVAYKYVSIVNMIAIIILTPIWSAFTDAYTKKDYQWMKTTVKKLEKLWLLCVPIMFIVVMSSQWFYKIWVGTDVQIPGSLTAGMAYYVLSQIAGGIYMYTLNGIGKIRVQLIVYWGFALISIPLLVIGCKTIGIIASTIIPGTVFFVQALVCRVQLYRIMSQQATGIWNK